MDKSKSLESRQGLVTIIFPFHNPCVNGSRIRVRFSVQVYSKGTAQPDTDSELKSLRWEIIHQNEWRAWIWACYWRLCGYAAFSQWIRGRANTAATPIKNIWRQAGETEKRSFSNTGMTTFCTKLMYFCLCREDVGDLYYHSVFTARLAALKTPCFL